MKVKIVFKYKIIFLLIMSLFISNKSFSGDLSDNEQNEFYKNCSPSCYKNQLSSKDNEMLLSTPYVLEAYCNCYCFKMATKSSRSEYNLMAKYAVTGNMQQVKQMSVVIKSNEACLRMIIEE